MEQDVSQLVVLILLLAAFAVNMQFAPKISGGKHLHGKTDQSFC